MKPYYEDEWVQLFHADCQDVLGFLEPVDLCLTDPPYNAGKDYGVFKDNLSEEEYGQLMARIVGYCLPLAKNQFWVAPRYQLGLWLQLLPKAHLIVIRRGASGPYRAGWADQFEIALAAGKPKKVFQDLWDDIRLKGEGYFFREHTFGHPGYTPSPIFQRALALYEPDSIVDPFAGTGTSLCCAKVLGITSVGIELNEAYCETAARRLETIQPSLFITAGKTPVMQESFF